MFIFQLSCVRFYQYIKLFYKSFEMDIGRFIRISRLEQFHTLPAFYSYLVSTFSRHLLVIELPAVLNVKLKYSFFFLIR